MADINFPTDTAELTTVATNDLVMIYDVSSPWDLQEAQAINIAKTLIDDTSTTATDRTWSVNKSKTELDLKASITGSQTLTNKTINADNNTITNLEVDNLKSGVLDIDLTSVSASDDTIPSAKATKAMWDLKIPLTYIDTDWTLTANSDVKLASQKAVKTYVLSNVWAIEPWVTNTYLSADTERTSSIASMTKVKEFLVKRTGNFQINFDFKASVWGASTVNARIYVNGVAIWTNRTSSSTTYVTHTENIQVKFDDLVQLYYETVSWVNAIVRNFNMKYDLVPVANTWTVNTD